MQSKREDILRSATETVRKSGSAALNFRDLGQSVGVKSSSVHYYFPTKSDLLEEIARLYRSTFIQALDRGIQNTKSFKQDLLVLVQLFVGARGENLSCLCGMLATEAELLDPKVKSATNDFFSALQGWVTRQAKQRNITRPAGLQANKFSLLLISLLEGALLLSRLEAHNSSLEAVDEWIRRLE
jgi:TetR/AcrR family transcriptional regulator, transcriptional repressor for nem operon